MHDKLGRDGHHDQQSIEQNLGNEIRVKYVGPPIAWVYFFGGFD